MIFFESLRQETQSWDSGQTENAKLKSPGHFTKAFPVRTSVYFRVCVLQRTPLSSKEINTRKQKLGLQNSGTTKVLSRVRYRGSFWGPWELGVLGSGGSACTTINTLNWLLMPNNPNPCPPSPYGHYLWLLLACASGHQRCMHYQLRYYEPMFKT